MNGRESLAQTVTLLSFVSAGAIAVAHFSIPLSQPPNPSPPEPQLEGEDQHLSRVPRLFPQGTPAIASDRPAYTGIPVIQAPWAEESSPQQPPPPQPFFPGHEVLAVRSGLNALQPMMLNMTQQAIAPVPASQSRIVVDLSDRLLTLQRDGHPDLRFPIAVGRVGWETPVGEFEVINKQPHPTWQNPLTGKVVPAGPDNPLGTRWIGFWTDGRSQLGFHGTNEPERIGQAISHGCIRMADRHVQELYTYVEVGSPVSIQF